MLRLKIRDPQFFRKRSTAQPIRTIDLEAEPSPTIMATGLRSVSCDKYWLETDGAPPVQNPDKPPYRVPSMEEIRKTKPNGFTAISLFAGAGGSSLGYRMAGYRMLWASEFVDAARKVYAANKMPYTVVDGRDIREVDPAAVMKQLKIKPGDLDVLDGSPPCASFSTAGKRDKHWGQEKKYSDKVQRTDDLFFEYVRFVKAFRPKVFVAENVSGLVKGVAKGYFLDILKALKECGYRVEAQLLDAQWLGVPQARQRIIFVGVRNDLELEPAHPKPLPYRYSVRDAIPWIVGSTFSTGGQNQAKYPRQPADAPAHTIGAGAKNATHHMIEARVVPGDRGNRRRREEGKPHPLDEPLTSVLASGGRKNSSQFMVEASIVGNSNASHSRKNERRSIDEPSRTIMARRVNLEVEPRIVQGNGSGHSSSRGETVSLDRPLPSVNAGSKGSGPHQFYVEGEADISGQAIGAEWDRLNPGEQSGRYFSLVRTDQNEPCPTVTAAGGMNSGIATVTHPTEKRKFAIAELKRICAFPDDFELSGSYAQQWERLGRAVPPLMMRAIAEAVRDGILRPAASRTGAPPRRSPDRSTKSSPPKGAGKKRTSHPNGNQRAKVPPGSRTRGRRSRLEALPVA